MNRRRILSTTLIMALATISLFAQEQQIMQIGDNNGRFGIGLGYDFLNLIKQEGSYLDKKINNHPIGLNLKYRINKRHEIIANIPITVAKQSYNDYGLEDKNKIYGIGVGYNYLQNVDKNLNGFVGMSIEYANQKQTTNKYDISKPSSKKNTLGVIEYKNNIYSIIPQIGLQYNYKKIEIELKYKLYASTIKNRNLFIKYKDATLYDQKATDDASKYVNAEGLLHDTSC